MWLRISSWLNMGIVCWVLAGQGWRSYLRSRATPRSYEGMVKGVNQTLTTNTKIPLNTWSHIVIRYDAMAAGNQRQKIYINGVADTARGNDANSLRANTQNLEIGRDYIDSRSFNGRIDEVAIYGSALSDTQIAELYSQRHPCGGSRAGAYFVGYLTKE
ncbi:LamG domain-containing protein, partial [Aeromonas veronii]|uniref:LamG domain-containing protein n=1 Tax=Aeromonas veronii TaxID=654 RepID=UPI00313AD5F2